MPSDVNRKDILLEFWGAKTWDQGFQEWLNALPNYVYEREVSTVLPGHNLHTLVVMHETNSSQECYANAAHCYIDGYGAWFLGRLLGQELARDTRFSLMDRLPNLLSLAEKRDWRLFFYGGTARSNRVALQHIRNAHPDLIVAGLPGYEIDDASCVQTISDFSADVLFVGLGTPKQETWIRDHSSQLRIPLILPCGATLDYVSGAQAKPPIWMSKLGLAWLYRLALDPRRLGNRYLVEPLKLVPLIIRTRRRLNKAVYR